MVGTEMPCQCAEFIMVREYCSHFCKFLVSAVLRLAKCVEVFKL